MPIGVIAAAVGAASSIGGALLSSSAQKKAAKTAANTAQQTTNANNALTQGIYNQNSANIRPFIDSGLRAQGALNGLLYGPAQMPANALYAGPGQMDTSQFSYAPPGYAGRPTLSYPEPYGGDTYSVNGGATYPLGQFQPGIAQQPGMVQTAAPSAQDAWQQFFDSSGARSVLNEGQRAINVNYAARGTLQSGAAQKALQDRGQQQLLNNYLMPYMNLLQGQQNVGLSGANALAGVGTNMVNAVTANNNSASSAASNAALFGGQANANMYGGIASALGNFAGTLSSSYGKPAATSGYVVPPPGPWYQGY